jgi:hypothetical protein
MAGYVNSWIEKYQDTEPACIGDTINQSYDGSNAGMGLGPIGSCWMWLVIGAVAVYLLKDQKK